MTNSSPATDLDAGSWPALIRAVFAFVGHHKRSFLCWSAVLVVCQFYSLVPPLLIGQIVDFFLHFHPGNSLQPFYTEVIILGVGTALAAYIRLKAKDHLGKIDIDIVYQAKIDGFDRLMRYPLSWHQKENTGSKMQRLQGGLGNLRQLLRVSHDDLPNLAISFIGVLTIFLFLDWLFAAFLIIYLAIFFVIEYRFYQRLLHTNHQFNRASETSSGTYLESANNVLTIKTMGATQALKRNLDTVEVTAKDLAYNSHHLVTKKWQYFQIINALALATFLLIVGHSVLSGSMTAGAIFVYFSYFQRLSDAATNGITTLLNMIEYKSAIERMLPIYHQAPRKIKGQPFPARWQSIEIVDGHFLYQVEGQQFEINNLNLSLRRGQKIGVVGRSGSGKSTLAKLLLGIYKLDQGNITIGNQPLDKIDADDLTKHITIVAQETELFNLTLRENITMMKNIPDDQLQRAIKIACLQPVIDKMPKGLDTKIGERGGRLSGGEKQRIGIARAICANTEILVLDEATSALDSKTEILVQQALERELEDKTLIIIAHRLMTLTKVDRIIVFDKGKIIEQDAFNRLLSNANSAFYQLYKLQQPQPIIPFKRLDLSKTKQLYPAGQTSRS